MMKFFINDNGRLWNFDSDGVGGKIVIPQGVKTIGWKAFTHPSLFRAVIPDSVEVIEEQAFLNCESLHEVIIPDSVKSIGFEAFSNCSCLNYVSIPESVTDINPYAFHTVHNFGEYRQMSGDFCIYGKRGSAAERFANENSFPFRENEADENSLLIGGDVYDKPDMKPDWDGNTVVICQDEEYTWGISADGYPYESYQNMNNPHDSYNYCMPVPWIDLYDRIDELCCIFRWNGFPGWAEEYQKIKERLKKWPRTDSVQASSAVSVEEMRMADRLTIERGTSGRELMRRAAQGVFDAYEEWDGKSVAVFCGSGNNGGDGYALAEILHDHGIKVTVFRISDKFSEDGAYYYNRCIEKDISISTL